MKPYIIPTLAVLVAIGFPRFSEQGYSYQHSLWTSEWMKSTHPSSGFRFEVGHAPGALIWDRTRLGFPLGATTIDSRFSDHVFQARVETSALGMNLMILGFPACMLFGLLSVIRRVPRVDDLKPTRCNEKLG